MPLLARIVSSNTLLTSRRKYQELKRKQTNSPHLLQIFICINDPYSYLLVQVLEDLSQRFNITIKLHTIYYFDTSMFPEKEMCEEYAFIDAGYIAKLYALKFPNAALDYSKHRIESYTQKLLELETLSAPLASFNKLFTQFWSDIHSTESVVELTHNKQLATNEALLKSLGHYMSAMIFYGGEWYWGIDRLDHLEQRLTTLKLNTNDSDVKYNKTYKQLCNQLPANSIPLKWTNEPLVLYFSIRSPYSHLGLEHAIKLSRHYNVELIIKPVLPMLMRGLPVPNNKKMYIFHDTKREAQKHNINYGYVADPLGKGVERCYALYAYAQSEGKATEYLLAYAQAVNALGVRSETNSGLKKIIDRCGLDWQKALVFLDDNSWRIWAESNLKEMYSLGVWGVPSLKYKNTVVWGQDRVFVIEDAIADDIKKLSS